MAKRYYLFCPQCRKRMRRTGRKELVHGADLHKGYHQGTGRPVYEKIRLYDREYECPNCGSTYWHDAEAGTLR